MATTSKRPRNTNIIDCPRCANNMELTFQGEQYKHFFCRNCECSLDVPVKESKLKEDKKYGRRNQ